MTGGGFVLPARGGRHNHDVQWLGKPGVKGPRWGRLPLLTVGMLGLQVSHRSLVCLGIWHFATGAAEPWVVTRRDVGHAWAVIWWETTRGTAPAQ